MTGGVVWLTGVSGSGKSTLAEDLIQRFKEKNVPSILLDGDIMRAGLCSDLGFEREDRKENARRLGEVAGFLAKSGLLCVVAAISPFEEDRQMAKGFAPEGRFCEVYIQCPIIVCEQRDPKGLWGKARKGEITSFTGLDGVYEAPPIPDIVIDTNAVSLLKCKQLLWQNVNAWRETLI